MEAGRDHSLCEPDAGGAAVLFSGRVYIGPLCHAQKPDGGSAGAG